MEVQRFLELVEFLTGTPVKPLDDNDKKALARVLRDDGHKLAELLEIVLKESEPDWEKLSQKIGATLDQAKRNKLFYPKATSRRFESAHGPCVKAQIVFDNCFDTRDLHGAASLGAARAGICQNVLVVRKLSTNGHREWGRIGLPPTRMNMLSWIGGGYGCRFSWTQE
jgi:hypothetical protein